VDKFRERVRAGHRLVCWLLLKSMQPPNLEGSPHGRELIA
jgi:hypothetical protein